MSYGSAACCVCVCVCVCVCEISLFSFIAIGAHRDNQLGLMDSKKALTSYFTINLQPTGRGQIQNMHLYMFCMINI